MIYFHVTPEFFDGLKQKLYGKVYIEATDLLQPLLNFSVIKVSPWFSCNDIEVYNLDGEKFIFNGKIAYPVRFVLNEEQYLDKCLIDCFRVSRTMALWKAVEGIKVVNIRKGSYGDIDIIKGSCQIDKFCIGRGKEQYYGEKIELIYCRIFNGSIYISFQDITSCGPAKSKEEFHKQVYEVYRGSKVSAIMNVISSKFNIRVGYYLSVFEKWKRVKEKYKRWKKQLSKQIYRGLLAPSLKEGDIRESGWKIYSTCEAITPVEKSQPNFVKVIEIVNDYRYNVPEQYCVLYDYKTISIVRSIKDYPIKRGWYKITDSVVFKYLKCSPEYLRTNPRDLPYHKWAISQLSRFLVKEEGK